MGLRKKGPAYHHGDLRRAVIDAAVAVITRDGTEALSLRDLARRLGVSHQAPYRHFADKHALLAAIADEGFARLSQQLRANPGLDTDLVRALTQSGVRYVRFALEFPAYYRVMFATAATPSSAKPTTPVPGSAYEAVTYGVSRGQAAGVLPPVPVEELALLSWTLVHGLAMLAIDGKLGTHKEALTTAHDVIALQVSALATATRAGMGRVAR